MSLPSQLETWFLARFLGHAFDKLSAQHLGQKLDAILDDRFGSKRSEEVQKKLIAWLKLIVRELEEDIG